MPNVISEHATRVTSIVIGFPAIFTKASVVYKYEGVVPYATVYQMAIDNSASQHYAYDEMADRGVSVINCSYGSPSLGYYFPFTQWLDQFITETNIVVVSSAGNEGETSGGYVNKEALAYNVITVGNAETLAKNGESLNAPYGMNSTSSYGESIGLPNKPDLVAPGSFIGVDISIYDDIDINDTNVENGKSFFKSGTSYSAPIITGIVAQMMQANYSLIGEPARVKTLLMLASSNDIITGGGSNKNGSSRDEDKGLLKDKSGAGFIDAVKAINYAKSNSYLSFSFRRSASSHPPRSKQVYLNSGQSIKIVMSFEKSEDCSVAFSVQIGSTYNTDCNVMLRNAKSGNVVSSAYSIFNNTDIITYTNHGQGAYFSVEVGIIGIETEKPYTDFVNGYASYVIY